jgi:hypothetical protein
VSGIVAGAEQPKGGAIFYPKERDIRKNPIGLKFLQIIYGFIT